jgi:nucleoside-diphosphate-sugar epimerase
MRKRALVAGAGGFIGHHMVRFLKAHGYWVRAADLKLPEFAPSEADEFLQVDLRRRDEAQIAIRGVGEVYQLAADMGGIGYITAHHAAIASSNVLINTHMLEAAALHGVERFFYASSACIYPRYRQSSPDVAPLREEDAYPADPEEGYGWEKLYSEQLCRYYDAEGLLRTRVARFHNVYGPLGTYQGGKEKAPAAICRKVALASDGGEIEVWGDGRQTRSFMYIDDCVEGIHRITGSDCSMPLNLGNDRLISVDGLVDLVSSIAGKRLTKRHDPARPQGVRGRNSDNSRLADLLNWSPSTSLEEGLRPTYAWIAAELGRSQRDNAASGAAC